MHPGGDRRDDAGRGVHPLDTLARLISEAEAGADLNHLINEEEVALGLHR